MVNYYQPYSLQRQLRNSIKADQSHLENAPLGPTQKKRLQEQIAHQKAELEKVNAYIRSLKQNKP